MGTGYNTKGVVDEAIKIRQEDGDFDQVWCVFDRDDFPAKHFNEALELARANGIEVAYSNEAFELWYILHFEFLNTGLRREDYKDKLTRHLGQVYRKNDPDMYEALESRQAQAINRAAKLLATYNPCQPEQDNPSTTVHLLVQELLKVSHRSY